MNRVFLSAKIAHIQTQQKSTAIELDALEKSVLAEVFDVDVWRGYTMFHMHRTETVLLPVQPFQETLHAGMCGLTCLSLRTKPPQSPLQGGLLNS